MVQVTGQECTHHIEGRFVTCVFNQILYEEHPNYQTRYKADLINFDLNSCLIRVYG